MAETAEQVGSALSFRCPPRLARAIEVAAAKQLLSKSDYVRQATLKSLRADGIRLDEGRPA
jgi:hypothetical protein